MPPLPNVPNVIKVVTNFTAETLTPLIITHFAYTGSPPSSSDCQSIAASWGTIITAEFAPKYPTDFGFGIITVTDLSSSTGGVGEVDAAGSGTNTSAALPGQVCMLLHKTISRRYRGGHPRTYLPAFATDQKLNDANWTAGAAVDAGNNWATAVGSLVADSPFGSTHITGEVNVSYRSGNAPRVTPVVDLITLVSGEQKMATQRRRLKRSA